MPAFMWNGARYRDLVTGLEIGGFVPGVTTPFYEVTANPNTSPRNVGTNPMVPLTTYTGEIVDGIATIWDAGLYENIEFPCFLDVRNKATFKNCRVRIPYNFNFASPFGACIFVGNGGAPNSGAVFEDFEIINQAQRPLKGMTARNVICRRMVIVGCYDGWSDGSAGSAPQDFAFDIYDSIVPSLAYWYSNPANPMVHPSDVQTHADCIQKVSSGLHAQVENCVLLAYVDPLIGIGTPGAGSDAGNTYVPPSGHNFITTQAAQNATRAQYCDTFTDPPYSYGGESHTLSDASYACLMGNAANIDFVKCIFGGGTVSINALDDALGATTIDMGFTDCTFWNDMKNGHGSNPATKGHGAIMQSGRSFRTFTNNRWGHDNSLLTRQTEGAYQIYR